MFIAVVRVLDKNKYGETQLRTAAVLRKGMSFGVCKSEYPMMTS